MTATYDIPFQNKIIAMALRDQPFLQRVEGLIQPSYFDTEPHSYLIDLVNRHYDKYREGPSSTIVIAEIKKAKDAKLLKDEFVDELKDLLKIVYSPAVDLSNREHTVDLVSSFAKERALEAALTKSIDIMEAGGDLANVEVLVREALTVGATEGSGAMDFADTVKERAALRMARLAGTSASRGITTGHREIDDLLFHKGWGRKELSVLMGAAKSGKSTGLQHFAINAFAAGHNVLYITVENSKEVTGDRIDSAMSGVKMKDLDVSAATIEAAVVKHAAAGGKLIIEEFPMGQCKVSDIRRVVRKFQAKGVVFDFLVVDYADEMRAERTYNDERHASSEIYSSLRALCQEENLAGLTATQTNRTGAKATTATSTDVAEDFNRVRKADVFISINATEEEKKANQMRLYLAAMRNSEGGITVHCMTDRSRMKFISKIIKIV